MSRGLALIGLVLAGAFAFAAYHTLRDDGPPLRVPIGASTSNSAKVATISHGDNVDLSQHAAKSGRTVFEYTADW